MKTCATCNASHKNTVERVLRCMRCVAKPDGNTNWRPMRHNTLDILIGAGVCAVNSCVSELRANGLTIECRRVGRERFEYRLTGGIPRTVYA